MSINIEAIIQDAENRAQLAIDETNYAMTKAQAYVNDIQSLDIEVDPAPNFPAEDLLQEPVDLPDVPDFQPGAGIVPNLSLPVAPQFVQVSAVTPGDMPVKDAERPADETIQAPSQIGDFSDVIEEIRALSPEIDGVDRYTFPDPPAQLSYDIEGMPVLPDRALPAAPVIEFPEFTAEFSGEVPTAPDDLADQYLSMYREQFPAMVQAVDGYVDSMILKFNPEYHNQMAALEAKLAQWVEGGTALPEAVEDAIWNRAKEKTSAEFRRTHDMAWANAAAKGFTLPNGALAAAVLQARMGEADANSRTANEIAIAQAELEQKNIQFAISTSTGLRQTVMQAALSYMGNIIQINGQASDAAKATVQALVDVFNAQVRAFEGRLELYKSEASVYEVQYRGQLAQVDIYKAELSALETMTQVDTAKLQAYRTKIESLQTMANVYRSQVETVVAKAGLQKLKLDMFSAEVQAYSARVQGKNAEWSAYEAQLRGKQINLQTYGEELKAYLADLDAWKADLEGQIKRNEADVRLNESFVRQYQAEFGAYEADIKAQATIQSAEIDTQKVQMEATKAQFTAAEAEARLNFEKQVRVTQFTTDAYRFATDSNFRRLAMELDKLKFLVGYAESTSKTYGNMASAALSGMNTLASAAM